VSIYSIEGDFLLTPVPSLFPLRRNRLLPRLRRHHLPLLLISFLCVAALYSTRPDQEDVISRASFATAYPALVLLAATLLIGPWKWLRSKPNPVSSDLRRDLGIWAGVLAVVHTAVGQCVHLRGRPWLYYVYGPTEHHHGLRHDAFGFANYTSAASALVVIALLATSNDYSLRRLWTRGWKKLQRWNYAVFGLAAVHALLYQEGIEKQKVGFVGIIVACIAVTIALQYVVFMQRRRETGNGTRRPREMGQEKPAS